MKTPKGLQRHVERLTGTPRPNASMNAPLTAAAAACQRPERASTNKLKA